MKYKEVKQHTAAVCVCVCTLVSEAGKGVLQLQSLSEGPEPSHRTAIYSIKLISTPVFLTKDKYKTRIQIYPRTTTNMTSGPEQF